MWQKLIELLLKSYLEGRTPKRKAAKALTELYSSMLRCQTAYRCFKNEKTDENLFAWKETIEELAIRFQTLRTTLQIHDPEVFELIAEFAASEARSMEQYTKYLLESAPDVQQEIIKDRFKHFTERSFYRIAPQYITVKGKEKFIWAEVPTDQFEKAIERLGQFIKGKLSFEETLDAQ